jgi:SAM-dependent methyltransferase
LLTISEREIRRHGPGNLFAVCWRHWRVERALARRGIRFRTTDLNTLAAAYAAMSDQEFDAINGLQNWANWRTIPRALSGHVPDRPLRVLDLGSGTGSSTKVLAFYCPAGSRITGIELALPLAQIARRQPYLHRSGLTADVNFSCQGVTERWCEAAGEPVADRSVDLVNASGVVGHHLKVQIVAPVIRELQRVLAPGGVAMLDVGPTLSAAELSEQMSTAGFQGLGRWRSWLLDPTGQLVFRAH